VFSESQRARAGVFHMRKFCGDYYTVVVAARTRQDADQSVGRRLNYRNAARQALEAAERHQDIFAVISKCRVCRSGPMPWISFKMVQVLVSTTMTPLAAGAGCSTDR